MDVSARAGVLLKDQGWSSDVGNDATEKLIEDGKDGKNTDWMECMEKRRWSLKPETTDFNI